MLPYLCLSILIKSLQSLSRGTYLERLTSSKSIDSISSSPPSLIGVLKWTGQNAPLHARVCHHPLLVGSRRDPNEEIPDFGSHREPKVRVSHSFGSRCEPKTGDLTSGSRCEPREWGWSPFLDHIVSPRRSDPCLRLITLWAKQRQDNQYIGTLYTYTWL